MVPLFQDEIIMCESSIEASNKLSCFPEKLSREPQEQEACCLHSSIAEAKPLRTDLCDKDDPFLYYSNDVIRMKALKLEEISDTEAVDNTKTSRKSRISFELHPSVLFEDMMEELYRYCKEDEFHDVNNEFTLTEKAGGSKLDLLSQLLQL
mmetsp:Transcript_23240/g.39733  ORF Transcript_23240/g.39733 Transcript_23240/m.39733 type:complete len:151 (-) Transcript_23240:60-512(-)|eukprot:CAMPEP_0183768746 /NCGR_PEP_ID=MMETSP0739-20130205/18841_1 /TAXON_ID=385413 /ORGANISM="Thalassiosira miniscula, Strain CCMP1093" /LENGTH=150 /DNA_ID=CAMNT_0026008113 /DNA_START=290 /DNA_END=742 /DNA_ORIENTATION=+